MGMSIVQIHGAIRSLRKAATAGGHNARTLNRHRQCISRLNSQVRKREHAAKLAAEERLAGGWRVPIAGLTASQVLSCGAALDLVSGVMSKVSNAREVLEKGSAGSGNGSAQLL